MTSIKDLLLSDVEKAISLFIKNLNCELKKHGVSNDIISKINSNMSNNMSNNKTELECENKQYTFYELNKMQKKDLIKICESRNLKITMKDTKLIMINTILGIKETENKSVVDKPKPKIIKKELDEKPVIKNLSLNKKTINIRTNKYGNLEHAETGLVFEKDGDNYVAVGKQIENGIINLTTEDIELCNCFKFQYKLPQNLNSVTEMSEIAVLNREIEENESDEEIDISDNDESENDEEIDVDTVEGKLISKGSDSEDEVEDNSDEEIDTC